MLHFQLCSARLHDATNKKTVEEVPLQSIQLPQKCNVLRAPIINYCLESAAAIMLRFQLCSAHYIALLTKNSVKPPLQSFQSPRKIRTITSCKCPAGKPCIALLRINTLSCQQKEMGHKGGVHDACIVRTVVCQKAHFLTKRRRTVDKSSP